VTLVISKRDYFLKLLLFFGDIEIGHNNYEILVAIHFDMLKIT